MKISDYAVDHPVPVTIVVGMVVVFGVLALSSLTSAMFPDFTKPTITVSVTYPGVSPEEIERQVSSVLEEELSKVSDVLKMSSRSLPSRSVVTLELAWSVDVDAKLVDVRERLAAVEPKLPEGISGSPVIRKINPSEMPILTVGVRGGSDLHRMGTYTEDEILPLISTIPGVSSVDLSGKRDRALEVDLNLPLLSALSVSPLEVAQAVSSANVVLPAGNVRSGDSVASVTTRGAFSSIAQAKGVLVGNRNGNPILLGDVADLRVADQDPERYVMVNGTDALLIDVMAQKGADTVAIIQEVKARLSSLAEAEGSGLSFDYYRDQSVSIDGAIGSVRNSALLGGCLAVLVLYLFLGSLGPTIIIALSIPFTIVVTFIALYLNGHTLNLMTLGGLTVAIGMIVDASIVMLEGVWRRVEGGMSAPSAAKAAGSELGGAIIASTLTSVVVFVPLVFVTGITGIILRDIALTIIYALAGSVIAAVLIVPFLSATLLKLGPRGRRGRLSSLVGRGMASLERGYARVLSAALSHSGFLIVASVALLALTGSLMAGVGFQFIPTADTREMIVELDAPTGTSVERMREVTEEVDAIIARTVPEAAQRVFFVGQGGAWSAAASISSHSYGMLSISQDGRSVFDLIPLLRDAIESEVPDLRVSVRNGGNDEKTSNALGGAGFRVSVSAPDIAQVMSAAESIEEKLRSDKDVAAVRLSVSENVLRLENEVDLDAAASLSVSPSDAAQNARIVFNGVEAGEFDGGDETVPVIVRSPVSGVSEDLFNQIPVKTRTGKLVALSAFSSLQRSRGLSEIPRENRMPTVQVVADLSGNDFRGVNDRLQKAVVELGLPRDVKVSASGSASETMASFRSLLAALAIGVLLVYAVMAIQFERYRQPLIVLSAIPFTLIGVILGLLAFGSSFSIIAFLGIISLAGVAVNNAIIMIDYTNTLRKRDGLGLRDAVVAGAASRVRPILMTTLTTVLGVLPLAFSGGSGATMAVLGQVILGGLSTSTLITFFITPSLYWLSEGVVENRARNREKSPVGVRLEGPEQHDSPQNGQDEEALA